MPDTGNPMMDKLGPAIGPMEVFPPADPAPTSAMIWPPEDECAVPREPRPRPPPVRPRSHARAPGGRHPWTADEEKKLRALVVKFQIGNTPIPWQRIALHANFGHNSGSCQKRFGELKPLMWQDCDKFYFPGSGGEVIASKHRHI